MAASLGLPLGERKHWYNSIPAHEAAEWARDQGAEEPFRKAVVNGILWTAKVDVPAGGAPCAITLKDMELPPDTRPKK